MTWAKEKAGYSKNPDKSKAYSAPFKK